MLRFVPKQEKEREIPEPLAALGVPHKLLSLLLDRGIDTPEKVDKYLHPKKEDLHDPMRMQDMEKAVAVVRDAIQKHEEIAVFGDYDVDGVTATAILLTYLRKQGAKATYYIPDRHGEGYGLNMAAVEQLATHAKLLITVDCGITCPNEVARARELGMRVIVTDHHQLGPKLPVCEAVLNPLLGDYPFRRLCGAGVAFKLVQALGGMEAIEPLWELAALATIADIVPLLEENRVIVAFGLRAMAHTQRPGLLALMESSGVDAQSVSASDVAFRMAPRINAGGRLALASRGVELLTTRKLETAREIAAELDQDNTMRRELEMNIFAEADEKTRREIDFLTERAIVVCGEGWNPGVIGLAASRLVEKYKWPTILLAQDGEICVGSARSIPGVNIHQAMSACSDLFVRFGGHAQAAGLTIEARHVPAFKRRLTQAILEQSELEAFIPTEEYDLELELQDMTEELVQAFSSMQPTGCGNPAPVFCVRGVHTTDVRTIGKEGAHLRMRLCSGSDLRSAIGFRMGDRAGSMPEVVEAVVGLSINEWQDRRSVQCELRQVKPYMPAKAFLSECLRREGEIDAAMLDMLSLNGTAGGRIESMPLEDAKKVLGGELLSVYQGTLMVVHTVSALKLINIHLAILHAQIDYAMHTIEDIRSFNTLVMAPDWEKIDCHPRAIVMLDGFLSDGERTVAMKRFPEARIIEVTDMRMHTAAACARLLPDDDHLRMAYRVLRQREKMEYSLCTLAAETGLTESQVLCAMRIFSELNLIRFTQEPLHYTLLRSGKVSLEASALRSRLMGIKG
ncbi:MAG: single-stranded-DNA-specific exonuclease RecJ [Christensenellales bacterium]|nr:single-stranded-DNA-specific exonuclease RecJ [Christensenellales bacterium]